MTPRESLEAAGMCSDCESNQCAASCRCPCHQKNANQAARLARDEAKETSDGRNVESVDGCAVTVSQPVGDRDRTAGHISSFGDTNISAAPVVTSVSAPDMLLPANFGKGPQPDMEGLFSIIGLRARITSLENELKSASSSSAALLQQDWIDAINGELSNLREWANKEAKRAEAAESKCAELQQQIRDDMELQKSLAKSKSPCGHLTQFSYTEDGGKTIECLVCVRDSRDRLQGQAAELRGQLEVRETLAAADLEKLKELEDNSAQDEREIEALQESLRTVRQDLADRDGIIIGLQDVAAGKTRPLTDIEAELRGNKS